MFDSKEHSVWIARNTSKKYQIQKYNYLNYLVFTNIIYSSLQNVFAVIE